MTKLPQSIAAACDALSIKLMIKINHICYTRKRVRTFPEYYYYGDTRIPVQTTVTYYCRYFTKDEPASLLTFREACKGGSWSVKKLPQAIALLSK
jgi:hypothetical protein